MLRIHGNHTLKRRTEYDKKSQYKEYLPILCEDFQGICGYCGKSIEVTKNAFEIDHFAPAKPFPALKHEYNNLVYSCYQCNRIKSSKFPTQNPSQPFSVTEGVIDPTSNEFDAHLSRTDKGE